MIAFTELRRTTTIRPSPSRTPQASANSMRRPRRVLRTATAALAATAGAGTRRQPPPSSANPEIPSPGPLPPAETVSKEYRAHRQKAHRENDQETGRADAGAQGEERRPAGFGQYGDWFPGG